MHRKIRAAAAVCLGLFLLLPALSACAPREQRFAGFAMGSLLEARLFTGEDAAARIWAETDAAVQRLDGELSAVKPDSEISRLNAAGSLTVSEETFGVLRDAKRLSEAAGGSLDITLGAATALWGFATDAPAIPDADALAAAVKTAGPENLLLDPLSRAVTLEGGARLDPGAVGKGAGTDLAAGILRAHGCPAVVNFGGTVLLFGKPPGRERWTVGLRDPFGTAEDLFAVYAFTPESDGDAVFISTSGSYEKQFTENGKTYHHILDPATGYPVETTLAGVSVVSGGGLISDGLSTACFVMGLTRETLALLEAWDAGAVFVFRDKSVYVTPALRGAVEIAASGFTEINDEVF